MTQKEEKEKPAPPHGESLEPPHVMCAEKWKRMKAEMAQQQK